MDTRMCKAKLTSLVGADSDHEMDATDIKRYPSTCMMEAIDLQHWHCVPTDQRPMIVLHSLLNQIDL